MTIGIYSAQSPSLKRYIGQSIDIERRINAHKIIHKRIQKGSFRKKDNAEWTKWECAMSKYEPDEIHYEIIAWNIPEEHLNLWECWFIGLYDSFNNGYNGTEGGHRSKRMKWTDEKKQKQSKLLKAGGKSKGKNNANFGNPQNRTSWCKGLTKETSPALMEIGKKVSGPRGPNPNLQGERNGMFGKKRTKESLLIHSEKIRNKPRIECPHCGKTLHSSGYKQYHGDKCKVINRP